MDLLAPQIKIVSHEYFRGVMDENETVKAMDTGNARDVLESLGYKKVREEKKHGCTIEIWERPEFK